MPGFVTNDYFIDEAAMVVFALTQSSGSPQQDMLDIRRIHYVNKVSADKWLDGVLAEVDRYTGLQENAIAAKKEAEQIHKRMSGKA